MRLYKTFFLIKGEYDISIALQDGLGSNSNRSVFFFFFNVILQLQVLHLSGSYKQQKNTFYLSILSLYFAQEMKMIYSSVYLNLDNTCIPGRKRSHKFFSSF